MAERALNLILDDINTAIKTVSFGSKITTRGLCYLQVKDEKTFPLENTNTKNGHKISWDDKYPLQTYHRILGTQTDTDTGKGFGKHASRTRVYTMRLVGIGSKTALSVAGYEDNQEIAKTVADAIPAFISSTEYSEVTEMEVIKQNVYDSEWAGAEIKKLSLEGVAFWVDYELKITYCGTTRNTDVWTLVYESDFSSGDDGWGSSNILKTGNTDGILGEDNTMSCEILGLDPAPDATLVSVINSALGGGSTLTTKATGMVYVPASNNAITGFIVAKSDGANESSLLVNKSNSSGAWVEFSTPSYIPNSANILFIKPIDSDVAFDDYIRINDTANNDLFYVKDIKIYQVV